MFSRSGSRSNFNPRSPHGERPVIEMNPASASRISIHAPRRGSDLQSDVGSALLGAISIHAPRRGSDGSPRQDRRRLSISIHAPRRGSDTRFKSNITNSMISIHAPRRGSDRVVDNGQSVASTFQSTLPAGGATQPENGSRPCNGISIHAPRRGSDSTVKAYSNDRIKRSTLREPHFLFSKNACFSPIFSMCATTSRTKNQRIRVSFGSYPGLAPMCFTLDWYRFPRL